MKLCQIGIVHLGFFRPKIRFACLNLKLATFSSSRMPKFTFGCCPKFCCSVYFDWPSSCFSGLKIACLLSRVRVQNTTIPILMIFITISDHLVQRRNLSVVSMIIIIVRHSSRWGFSPLISAWTKWYLSLSQRSWWVFVWI